LLVFLSCTLKADEEISGLGQSQKVSTQKCNKSIDLKTVEPANDPTAKVVLKKADRLFGLVTIYRAAKQHFAYFEQVPNLDWDQALKDFLPLVEQEQSLLDYYRTLQHFTALLKDGHTNVYLPDNLKKQLDNLPLRLGFIENKWIVIERMPSKEILEEDIPIGSIVLSIENVPPAEYFEKNMFPYIAHGTTQGKHNAINWQRFFPKNTEISVKLCYPNGSVHSRIIRANRQSIKWTEDLYKKYIPSWRLGPNFLSKTLENNILYVRYRICNSKNEEAFSHLIETVTLPETMILDLRGNSGGSTPHKAISHLISKTIKTSCSKTRCSISSLDASLPLTIREGDVEEELAEGIKNAIESGELPKGFFPGWIISENELEPNEKHFDGQLILLTNNETASAAEGFAVALHGNHRATVIGQPTSGSTGTPIFFDLPGGGKVRICTINRSYPDGKDFVGLGIQPDIPVKLTIKGIVEGKDETLENALSDCK